MIQLYHGTKVISGRSPPRGVRRVTYKNVVDVPKLLDGTLSFSNLRAAAPEFVPRPRMVERPEDAEDEPEVEEPEVDHTEIVNATPSAAESTPAIADVQDEVKPPSEKLIKAAIVFQTLYRKRLRYRKKNDRTLDVSRRSCFQENLSESLKINWPRSDDGKPSYYRYLFLGPLPYVQICLNAVYAWTMDNKRRNKERFNSAEHQELDEISKRFTEHKYVALSLDTLYILYFLSTVK